MTIYDFNPTRRTANTRVDIGKESTTWRRNHAHIVIAMHHTSPASSACVICVRTASASIPDIGKVCGLCLDQSEEAKVEECFFFESVRNVFPPRETMLVGTDFKEAPELKAPPLCQSLDRAQDLYDPQTLSGEYVNE